MVCAETVEQWAKAVWISSISTFFFRLSLSSPVRRYYSFGKACAGNCGGALQCFLFSIDYILDSRVSYDQSDLLLVSLCACVYCYAFNSSLPLVAI